MSIGSGILNGPIRDISMCRSRVLSTTVSGSSSESPVRNDGAVEVIRAGVPENAWAVKGGLVRRHKDAVMSALVSGCCYSHWSCAIGNLVWFHVERPNWTSLFRCRVRATQFVCMVAAKLREVVAESFNEQAVVQMASLLKGGSLLLRRFVD